MKKFIIVLLIIVCLAGGVFYLWTNLETDIYHSPEFPANTTINGIDCSKMTASEAADALTQEWNRHYVTFKQENDILGSIRLTGVTYDISDSLQNIRKDFFVATAMNQLFGTPLDMELPMKVSKSGTEFDKALESADYLKEDSIKETKNAYIDLNDTEMPVIDEVYGNNIDYDILKQNIFTLVADGTFSFPYVSSEFYVQPSITADNEDLLAKQEFYKENLTSNVTYTLGKDQIAIPPVHIAAFRGVKVSESGALTDNEIKSIKKAVSDNVLLEDAVREYVYQFACEYNTLGSTRTFKTTSGKKIKVEGGAYGFALDQDAEYEQLIKDLTSGKPVKRNPLWNMTGFVEYEIDNDIGNTYVEISIKKQHLWYYKDGKQIVSCDVVTGNPYMGYSTPTGTYGLSYKQYGATLRGENADGSKYESEVYYWMPFFGNYGMHDATWRSYFGDQIYLGGGSHGCVNMPLKSAEKLFNNLADRNVPVVVYDK